MSGRAARWAGLVVAAGLLAFAGGAVLVFGGSHRFIPDQADAIVVLSGTDERAQVGERLWRLGIADRLVVSLSSPGGSRNVTELSAMLLCEDPADGVTCFGPDPATTRGEARAVAELVESEGWAHVVVVTTGYHARRATMVMEQCLAARVTLVETPDDHNLAQEAWSVIHETGGILDLIRDPEC